MFSKIKLDMLDYTQKTFLEIINHVSTYSTIAIYGKVRFTNVFF